MPDERNPSEPGPGPARRFAPWLAAAIAAAAVSLWWINSAPAGSRDDVLRIPSGSSASRVAAQLEQSGAIRSRRWFLWMVGVRKAADRIHAGAYELKGGQSASRILNDLVAGKTLKVAVTVPEGFASWQTAERLESLGVCPADAFRTAVATSSAEGFLFPETYMLEQGVAAEQVRRILTAQFEKIWPELVRVAAATGAVVAVEPADAPERVKLADGRWWTRREIVTLASLVEREARHPEERPLIAAVYRNRLRKRMYLECDPTVQYALGYWKERLLYRDLDVESPYNTYRHFGLPPGPICSPGRSSILAALSPADVDYLYFVADEQGGHKFSTAYGAHLKEVGHRNEERRARRKAQRGK